MTDCSIIIGTRALDDVNGKVRLARSERGWPSIIISQSKMPITFASVLWKTRFSNLKFPCTSVSQLSGCDFLSAKKETISTWCGNLPTSRPSVMLVITSTFDCIPDGWIMAATKSYQEILVVALFIYALFTGRLINPRSLNRLY